MQASNTSLPFFNRLPEVDLLNHLARDKMAGAQAIGHQM